MLQLITLLILWNTLAIYETSTDLDDHGKRNTHIIPKLITWAVFVIILFAWPDLQ